VSGHSPGPGPRGDGRRDRVASLGKPDGHKGDDRQRMNRSLSFTRRAYSDRCPLVDSLDLVSGTLLGGGRSSLPAPGAFLPRCYRESDILQLELAILRGDKASCIPQAAGYAQAHRWQQQFSVCPCALYGPGPSSLAFGSRSYRPSCFFVSSQGTESGFFIALSK
jgi:hypothetical protein